MTGETGNCESPTVQLLVQSEGNQAALSGFLDAEYDVRCEGVHRDADLFLIEDACFLDHEETIKSIVEEQAPVYCPVILIQATDADESQATAVLGDQDPPVVDDVIRAPVREPLLNRRVSGHVARRAQSRTLDQQVGQLETQRDGLEVLNEMVRHDIRNDLQTALGHAKLLRGHVEDERGESLEAVIASIEQSVELTTDAKELTELLLAEDEDIGTVSLRSVVESELQAVRDAHKQAEVQLDGDVPDVAVRGNQMLASVVRNVLTNAIFHNDTASPSVTLTVRESSDSVRLAVADDGPGIPEERREQVFEKGATGQESSGSGFGLYLVGQIVDRFDGEVQVTDNEPRGATVEVTLPRA